MLRRTLRMCWLVAAIAIATPALAAQDPLLAKARSLLDHSHPAKAYALLSAQQDQREGHPDFDFLLGLAALNSGKPALAVFALERVLALQPHNARARAEIARAYFDMGETGSAKEEFETVKRGKLPPGVEKTIDKYLSAIDRRVAAERTHVGIFVESGFGYDSNVNSATDSSTVAIPALGGLEFTLNRDARDQSSAIWRLDAGFQFATPLSSAVNLFGGATLSNHLALDQPDFSARTADGVLGLELTRGDDRYRLSVQGQRFFVEGAVNRDLGGVTAAWQHKLNARNQLTAFAQAGTMHYPGQGVRNVNRYVGGVGWAGAIAARGNPVLFASAYVGTEVALADGRDDIGRNFVGTRLGGQYSFSERLLAYTALSYQYSRYGGNDPLFLTRRRDHFAAVSVGTRYAFSRNWSLNPELRYTRDASTLPINDYDRVEVMVTVRNDF